MTKALIAGLVGAAMMIAAVQAVAGPTPTVKTDDRGAGGRAKLTHVGGETYRLRACDEEEDGFGVRAYASFQRWGKQNLVRNVEGVGRCADGHLRIQSKHRTRRLVWISVCLMDHDGDRSRGNPNDPIRDRFCGGKWVRLERDGSVAPVFE
jgi:hypothetical protein